MTSQLSIFQINLIIALSISAVSWLFFLRLTRGIKTAVGGGACDNDYLLRATSKSNEWKWPSDMHTKTYTGTSTSQRDTTVLLILLFQKIFQDKKGEYPIIALWGFAHAVSILLVYLIGAKFWNPNIGLLVSILYLSSFWMWQMSLYVAHLNVGTMFFLLAVYFATLSISITSLTTIYALLFVSGIFFCCMLFASSSSPRYILPFFTALFFAKYQASGSASLYLTAINNHALYPSLIITSILGVFLISIKLFYRNILTAVYDRRAWFLNGLISAKKYPLEHYLEKADRLLPDITGWIIKPYIFLFIVVNLVGFGYFIPVFLGFLLVTIVLTMPDFKRSLTFYFNYLYISYIKPGINSGLVRYVKYGYFAKNNLPIPSNLRGGGFWWVPKIYFRMAPFHTFIYLLTLFLVGLLNLTSPVLSNTHLILLILASLLPVIWAEYTKAYQVARSYSTGLLGFLVLIGFGAYIFEGYSFFWPVAIILLTITAAWNAWKFFAIIYPARMSFNRIIKTLKKLGIKEIYTYNNMFNESFLDNVRSTESLNYLKINFINSLKDVPNGWILIPTSGHKIGYTKEPILEDFTEDSLLNELLETKKIEKLASARFQTVQGSDNIWLQESDITSYMDLMLRYITPKDRFRGYSWLLHSSKLDLTRQN